MTSGRSAAAGPTPAETPAEGEPSGSAPGGAQAGEAQRAPSTPSSTDSRRPTAVRLGMTAKLSLAITPVIAIVMALFSYARVRREAELFDQDMRRDHAALAHAVAMGAQSKAASAGPDAAIRLIEEDNSEHADVEIRWVPSPNPNVGARQILSAVLPGRHRREPDALLTTVPVRLSPTLGGHVQLLESLQRRGEYLEQSVLRTIAMAATLVLLCAGVIYAVVWSLLGRRMAQIIDRIQAIGDGDLAGRLDFVTDDEIGVFARELDAMCAELAEIQEQARRSTEARLATLEQLRHADRLNTVGKLASGIAHELGTPLNVVAARAKMILRESQTPEEVAEDAHIIAEQVERMTRIIRQLLDFARVGKLKRAPTALGPLVGSTLSMLEPLARKDGVALETEGTDDELLADVDAGQIQQALANLIMNAIQAQPGGGRVRVTLERARGAEPGTGRTPSEHVTLAVQDEGSGMSQDTRERAFEPFYTTKDVGQGTGLGLSVSHGIIVEHGGWLELDSEPGRGSRFTIHLPLVAA
jgi:two-component system NtrC family sensor kinase